MTDLNRAGQPRGQLLRDAVLTFIAVLIAFAAFDDITTDTATTFTFEWRALGICAAWLLVVSWRLVRAEHRWLGSVPVIALVADAPTPLRFAAPGKLVDALTAAGFRDAREDRRSLVLPWPGPPDELWQHLYDIAIPLRPLFEGLSGDERSAAIGESVAGYAKYYDGKTVNVPASIVTVSAAS